ncbi:MAG: UDP-N-acetylglucosamine 2-epimerase (non-hydrolyzing) [bacterium]|nr:UDP-N-acetylglucosamine 2-epimerase (non-hydrolyzing) [bacterium]
MKILFVFGTRPEAIKLAPLIAAFQKRSGQFDARVCVTGQHREMLHQVLDFFGIEPRYNLDIMRQGQSLVDITVASLQGLAGVLTEFEPQLIIVQGDTTAVLTGALAGFYHTIPVAHVEAGLRSGNKQSPFPEEMNRVLTGHMAEYHFAPTPKAEENLNREGITKNIWVIGNTVIDALYLGLDIIQKEGEDKYRKIFSYLDFNKKILLVTGHRRESLGLPFENMCKALHDIIERNSDVEIIYPVHLNPRVREPVERLLGTNKRIHLVEPLEYPSMIWLMQQAYLVITDSGGIQEEAPALGKPVLVTREVTERVEGIDAGTAILVGTDREKIVTETERLLNNKQDYDKMARAVNPYGDGKTSERIVEVIEKF